MRERLPRRDGLRHAPEDDARPFALEPHRNDADAGLEPNRLGLERPTEHERGAEHRMAGEGKLGLGREDPQADVRVAVRRVDEDRLRERHLAGEALQVALGDLPRVREHRELVAGQWPVREDVTDDVAKDPHWPRLYRPGSGRIAGL